MEYLNLEKGGLITILIPLNLLIGEYTLFFRLNGWSRKIIHLITGVIDLFFVVATAERCTISGGSFKIDVVQFPSGLGGNDIIEKTFKGPIQQQLRDALQYIKNVIITEKVVKHPDRAEADRFFNFPYAAVEEALSNAVYHRAYDAERCTISGGSFKYYI